jgi:hypothetical protein
MPVEILQKIRAIPPPWVEQGDDIGACTGGNIRDFSIAHGYNMLCNFDTSDVVDR